MSSMMNDVWKYDTKRESACSSSVVPYTCSGTTCTSADVLSIVYAARTVWRAPTANGAPCTSAAGLDFRDLWAMVEMSPEECPCPQCLTPPAGDLPSHMANESYLSAYTLVSAASVTRPLECAPGKLPNGSFTCVVDTPYIGKFQEPFPFCYPSPCYSPPVTDGILKYTGLDMAGTDGKMNCSNISSEYSMKSGGVCAITCDKGFTMAKGFECFEGTFQAAQCIPLTPCSQTDVSVKGGAVECSGTTTADFGETCPITCDMENGFMPYEKNAVATCDVDDAGTMGFVAAKGRTLDDVCVPTTCTPPEVPANGANFTKVGTSIDASWTLTCAKGYVVDASKAVSTSCQKSGTITEPIPSCIEAAGCDASDLDVALVTNAQDAGDCVAGMKDADECQVTCAEGFVPVGKLLCNNGKLDGIITCLSAEQAEAAEEVEMVSSAFTLQIDLTGKDQGEILSLFTSVIAKTLGIDENNIAKVEVSQVSRRLAAQRRLQAGYEVAYQAIVPEGVDVAAIVAKASDIGSGGDAQAVFLQAMADEGVTVDASSLKVTVAPKTFTATVVRGEGGKPIAPSPPEIPTVPPPEPPTEAPPAETPAPAPAAEEEGGGNVGAIVGGVVGAVVGLVIIGGVAYYFLVVRKRQME
eukprot:gnl/TRDRNA2_/TRDRNA2_177480_c14_seq1.p1 gnl/TRDRNA2_/TRDRNA2_177480_c14~~gnl/TRDRNA2_/TRDRNA2_177480_c14_seq1.p1  ORF type:complete len:647 (-),score=105.32 gnl/TRDRNA2_/TRDRNA2_177480_c14_seq1:145-2061(-)